MMHMRHAMMAHRMFEREDADHDGKVSLAEAEKAALDRFERIDTNHDGVISDAERDAAHQQMAARFRARRAQWMEHKSDMPPPAPQG
jgi:Ca2+-binding EF-hand superfamily protein